MADFTPISALIGGALIGLSAGALWYFNGRTAGISGILGDALIPRLADGAWRWTFLAGLLAGGFVMHAIDPAAFDAGSGNLGVLAGAGLLVGFGARLGGGCTSGHGICGLARLSVRSLTGVAVFMGSAALVVFAARHLLQGAW